jgi:hypothetical protein
VTVTVEDFRGTFKAFTDANRYDSQMVEFWLGVAYLRLPADRWGNLLDLGAQLYTAHNIVLEAKNQLTAKTGGMPGTSAPISSKTAGKVTVAYDNGVSTYENAGHYNQTDYGRRFWELVQIIGAGPVQVGIGPLFGAPYSGQPWPGPLWPWSS